MSEKPDSKKTGYIGAGVAFIGSGVALMTTVGAAGAGLLVIGIVFVVLGFQAKKTEQEDGEDQ